MMGTKLAICLAICVCLAGVHAAGQEGKWGNPDDHRVKEIVAAAKMWAETNCGPQPGLEKYFAQEFQGTATDGRRYGRADAMAPANDRDCQLWEVKVQFFGDVAAVAYGSESSIRKKDDGTEWQRCLAWTDTWLKRGGQWQIIAAQDNVIACK